MSVAAHDEKRQIQMELCKDMPYRPEKLIYDRDEAGVEKRPCAPAEYIPVGKQIVPQYDRYIGDSPDDVSGLLLVRYEARLRSLERQVADLKDEVRRLRG